ncbi:MAG: helix-turn-helix transcriptional regulator [Myxococcales bacterium]|nr:helix-turn-helix transcriptional regulator [Myxococcales bacterium]
MPKATDEQRQRDRRALGERIATLRRRAGLSQPELAERLGVRTATVSNWERGEGEPQLLDADAVARALSVDINVLTGRAPLPPRG